VTPVVVVHADAARLVEALRARVEDVDFVAVDRLDAIEPALDTHRPEVVFAIKSSRFIGPEFHTLVRHEAVRWIHVGGSGVEHLGAWDDDRIHVTNSAGVLAPYLAETWVGAVLALDGGLFEAKAQRTWSRRRFRTVRGQRLLLVGLGEVGGRVASLASALGMEVEAIRRHPERGGAPKVFGPEALDDQLPHADIVSLHLRLDASTHRLFDRDRLARLRPGAPFVNTARGGLVDEAALVERLVDGHLRGAWLDVFASEPLPPSSPLWSLDQVLVTPHAADQIEGWDLAFVDRFVEQLARWRASRPLSHRVIYSTQTFSPQNI
jgi:phosphoglycerate dehydrogenase-like enzyme